MPFAAHAGKPTSSSTTESDICRISHGDVEWLLESKTGEFVRGHVTGLEPTRSCNNHLRFIVAGTRVVTTGVDVDFELHVLSGPSCHVADAIGLFDVGTGQGLISVTDRETDVQIEYPATLSNCLSL